MASVRSFFLGSRVFPLYNDQAMRRQGRLCAVLTCLDGLNKGGMGMAGCQP